MNKQRLSILIIAAIGVLSTFMPWATIPIIGGMSGFENTLGKVALGLFLIPLISSLIGDKERSLRGALHYIVLISGILVTLVALLQLYVFTSPPEVEDPLEAIISEQISVGFGLIVTNLCAVMLIVFLFLMKSKNSGQVIVQERVVKRTVQTNNPTQRKAKKPSPPAPSNSGEGVDEEPPKPKAVMKDFKPSDPNRFMP